MKHFLCCALILIFQAFAFSQGHNATGNQIRTLQQDKLQSEAARLIESSASRDQAWAAYLIGKYELESLVPRLYPLLDLDLKGEGHEVEFVHRAALDSLIQLDAKVPGNKLLPLYAKFPNEVLILLARSPKENQLPWLFIAQQSQRQVYWLAACNLLTETRAPGFAAWLMKELKVEIQIAVFDPRDLGKGVGGGTGGGVSVGDGVFGVPDGFPPTAVYKLTEYAKHGVVVAAPGLHTIYYERRIVQPGLSGQIGVSSIDRHGDRDRYRLEYLATLLKTKTEDLKLDLRKWESIFWRSPDQYQREVAQIRQQVEERYQQLIKRLLENNLLSDSEANSLAPTLVIKVNDLRTNPSVPLPEIHGVVKLTESRR
jgi:hypothetical protein